jgi:hypothetical protein
LAKAGTSEASPERTPTVRRWRKLKVPAITHGGAYLSTQATATARAVNARDRIGGGPEYNANGDLIALESARRKSVIALNRSAVGERARLVRIGIGKSRSAVRHINAHCGASLLLV